MSSCGGNHIIIWLSVIVVVWSYLLHCNTAEIWVICDLGQNHVNSSRHGPLSWIFTYLIFRFGRFRPEIRVNSTRLYKTLFFISVCLTFYIYNARLACCFHYIAEDYFGCYFPRMTNPTSKSADWGSKLFSIITITSFFQLSNMQTVRDQWQ